MKIPGYRVERLIGRGGMAAVYLAIQESLGRPVALKVLYPGYANTPEFAARFLDEGRIIAALNHTNIITIHDIGIAGESPYISMEYVEGGDLRKRIAQGMQPDEALDLVQVIGGCLSYAHRVDIVHRDVKPANILFRTDGTPLLTDFGIAKQLQEDNDRTATGALLGSPHYLSPEQARGIPVDGRADIYSLGIVFYEMLTGKKPYCGDSDVSTVFQHLRHPIPRLSGPLEAYQSIVDRTLAKEPANRFQDAGTLVRFIEGCRRAGAEGLLGSIGSGSDPVARLVSDELEPAGRPHRRHGFRWTGSWAGVAMGLVAGLTLSVPQPTGTDRPSHQVFLRPSVSGAPSRQSAIAPTGAPPGNVASAKAKPKSGEHKRATAPPKAAAKARTATRPARNKRRVARVFRRPVAGDGGGWAEADVELEQIYGELSKLAVEKPALERWLKLADRALADYRLTTPPRDSAYHYYRKALALDPGNARARAGLRRIADRYAGLAEGQMAKYRYGKAQRYVALGLGVQPDNRRLLKLKQEARARNAPKQMLDGVKSLFRGLESKLGGDS